MARRVFFSFHYQRDVTRANVVKNSWMTKEDREDAGFFDSSAFETFQRQGDEALKRFLNNQMTNSSVVCVLIGNQTAYRRWVRYEILRGFLDGRGIMGIWIYRIQNFNRQEDTQGPNPLDQLGIEIKDDRAYFTEYDASTSKWIWARDIGSMSTSHIKYDLGGRSILNLGQLFRTYAWFQGNGYQNLGTWIDSAARKAGR